MHRRTARTAALTLLIALLSSSQVWATSAEDRAADQLFGYSYGEAAPTEGAKSGGAAGGSTLAAGEDKLELEFRGASGESFLDHEARRGSTLKQLGISGTGTGASLLGLGGVIFLSSRFIDEGKTLRTGLSHGGLTLVGLGGALFVAGAIMLGIDASRTPKPMPTADGRGAQLVYGFAF